MSFHKNKLSFQIDEMTGEIIQPQIFLCDRQLNRICEIDPVLNLRLRCLLQGADEISFRIPEQAAAYDMIREYSVVLAKGFGYFEVSPTIHDSSDETKEIHGSSLGECELSQLLCTLECNTDSDIARDDYVPTVLYNKNAPDSSLIHRILSDHAPTYQVGHVDDTIQSIQRTFSFSKLDILSCFSRIAEEIDCFFEIHVQKAADGTVIREINIYDAQFCHNCQSRSILNGECQNCGSTNIDGIGEDTTITIGTDHLSDEITLSTDDRMKNCFLVEGGDDLITNTINGINPSGNNKIYLFSEETINSFSPALRERYGNYVDHYRIQQPVCEEIYETECNIFDLILYLQSGRMPETDRSKRDLKTETDHILSTYKDYFPNGLGTLASLDSSSPNSTVRQIFSLLAGTGYAVRQEHGSYDSLDQKWTGDIIIYDVENNDSRATIHFSKESSTITYTTSDPVKHDTLCIRFSEDDQTYIRQRLACETKNVGNIRSKTENAPKDWKKYSLKRLQSFRDSYYDCIRILENLRKNSDLEPFQNMADDFVDEYENYIEQISEYTVHLEDMIYFLYLYYGSTDKNNTASPSSQDMDYSSSAYPNVYDTMEDAFQDMVHYIRYGTWLKGAETENTDCSLYCSSCGSTNITDCKCNNCGSPAVTYANIAQSVYRHCKNKNANLLTQRTEIHDSLDLKTFLGDRLYKELYSHIREDVYTNSNFVSDGMEMNNSKLIRHAKELLQKAEHELARACVPQHTLTGNIYSFAAYRTLNSKAFPIPNAYDKFILGNFMRYISRDGTIYKLRLSSEEFSWEDHDVSLNVEFTNVVRSADHSIRDIETLIRQVGSLASSFDCVKKQAEQGETANVTLDAIKKEGLYSALGNVLNARNQDIQITENGITLREYDPDLQQFDKHQMKLINRNLVMTEDNWKTAKMAIGLGQYGEKPVYGVWADLLVGTLLVGEELKIENGNNSVVIDKDGITLDGGAIRWKKKLQQADVEGLNTRLQKADEIEQHLSDYKTEINEFRNNVITSLMGSPTTEISQDYVISPKIAGGYLYISNEDHAVEIDPSHSGGDRTLDGYLFCIRNKDNNSRIMSVDTKGNGYFSGKIKCTEGQIADWSIDNEKISAATIFDDGIGQILELNSKDVFLKSTSTSKSEDEIPVTNTSIVSDGRVNCRTYYGSSGPNNRSEYMATIGGRRIKCEMDPYSDHPETYFELDDSGLKTEVPIYYKGESLGKTYCVVQTGEHESPGIGKWKQFSAEFDKPYESEPFINVMPATGFSTENIMFDGFHGSPENGYTGFDYSIYCANPEFSYKTKWFAVGNVKR